MSTENTETNIIVKIDDEDDFVDKKRFNIWFSQAIFF